MKKPTVKKSTFFGSATSNPEGPTPSVESNQKPFSKMPKNSVVMRINQFFSKKTADILIHTHTRIQKKDVREKNWEKYYLDNRRMGRSESERVGSVDPLESKRKRSGFCSWVWRYDEVME